MNLYTYLMIKKAADDKDKYINDLEDIYNDDAGQLESVIGNVKDRDPNSYIAELEKDWSRLDATNRGRGNTIRRQAAEIDAMNNRFTNARENARRALAEKDEQISNQSNMLADNDNTINRMRRNASIGGAVSGAAIGGGVGYAGSNWLANKLKLTGRKALAAKLLGTAAGTALGGAGGYYLGRNI